MEIQHYEEKHVLVVDIVLCVCVCARSQAIAACMATFLMDVLTAGNRLNAKVSSVVEKVQPFTRPDVLQKKGKSKKKVSELYAV